MFPRTCAVVVDRAATMTAPNTPLARQRAEEEGLSTRDDAPCKDAVCYIVPRRRRPFTNVRLWPRENPLMKVFFCVASGLCLAIVSTAVLRQFVRGGAMLPTFPENREGGAQRSAAHLKVYTRHPRILTVLTTYNKRSAFVKPYKTAVSDRQDGYQPMVSEQYFFAGRPPVCTFAKKRCVA